MIFLMEKSPNRGLMRRKKDGLGLGFRGFKENWAEIVRGESIGDPKTPTPEERERVNGDAASAVVVEEGE